MKKIFLVLLLACSLTTTASAQTQKSRKTNVDNSPYPTHVMETLNAIDREYGNSKNRHFEVNRNPNTGIIESRQQIDHFRCGINSPELLAVSKSFLQDEPKSYQFLLITPGKEDLFQLTIPTKDPQRVDRLNIRTSSDQEMWLMCCKNPDNPQLRDAYAIVWKKVYDERVGIVEGDIFKITSLRPDLVEMNREATRSSFTIDGRVGYDLTDSLYVFYMADTYDELNELVMMTDSYAELKEYMKTHNNVLPMPVGKDKRFGLIVDIDKYMGGRIRTVMPDGSLCKLWTNIDMVPGETYHITTHNGYYDEDRDYEFRFGHYSQKSMFRGRQNDDVELTGGYVDEDEDTVAVYDDEDDDVELTGGYEDEDEDTVAVYDDEDGDGIAVIDEQKNHITTSSSQNNRTKSQSTPPELSQKAEMIENRIHIIENLYQMVGKQSSKTIVAAPVKQKKWANMDLYFEQIYEQNKQLDKEFEAFFKETSQYISKEKLARGYKEVLNTFANQNTMYYNQLLAKYGHLSKAAQKTQKQVIKLTEKYLKNLNKLTLQTN